MRAVRLAAAVLVAGVLGSLSACAGRYRAEAAGGSGPPGVVDVVQYRLDLAHQARDELRARWIARGAIPRPPMPPPLAEEPGDPPFLYASWVPGTWVWSHGQWRWRPGYWTEPDIFVALDDPGIPDAAIGVGLGFALADDIAAVRDHRDRSARTIPAVRDHRDRDRYPAVRDHRDRSRYPAVRDHRKGKGKDTGTSGDNDNDLWSNSSSSSSSSDKVDDKDFGGGRFFRPQ